MYETYYNISNKQIRNCIYWLEKCIICNRQYKTKENQQKVIDCIKNCYKIYTYVIIKYINKKNGHMVNFLYCILKHKANIKVNKVKKLKKYNKKKKKK